MFVWVHPCRGNVTFLSTDLLSSTVDIAFFEIERCETASRLSLEGFVVHLLKSTRQEPSEQREYCAFFVSHWFLWVHVMISCVIFLKACILCSSLSWPCWTHSLFQFIDVIRSLSWLLFSKEFVVERVGLWFRTSEYAHYSLESFSARSKRCKTATLTKNHKQRRCWALFEFTNVVEFCVSVNGSAFFDCGHYIFNDSDVWNCLSWNWLLWVRKISLCGIFINVCILQSYSCEFFASVKR